MSRFLLACVVVAFGVPCFAVDVAKEAAEINRKTSDALRAGAARDRVKYTAVMDERKASLEKLVATAEAEKSTEHLELARIYLSIEKSGDAVRHARAAVEADQENLAAKTLLLQALAADGKADEAVALLRSILAVEVTDENARTYLASVSSATSNIIRSLQTNGKFDVAEGILKDWQAKLDGVKSEDDGIKQLLDGQKRSLAFLKSSLASGKMRAELIGKSHFPLESPTWLNGEAISAEQLHGKVVLLDFWAVWCGPCIATFPHLIEWHEKYADKGLVIVGVTRRYQYGWDADAKRIKREEGLEPAKEDEATVAFAKHHGLKHRLAVMPEGDTISQKYGVTGIPQVVVIDRSGVIRLIRVGSGEKNAHDVEAEIRKLLGLDATAASE